MDQASGGQNMIIVLTASAIMAVSVAATPADAAGRGLEASQRVKATSISMGAAQARGGDTRNALKRPYSQASFQFLGHDNDW